MKKLLILPIFVFAFPLFLLAQSTATEWFDKGVSLIDKKDFTGAISAFKNAIAQKADYGDAYYQTGWCYNDLEKYQDAVTYLEKAKQLLPKKAKVHFELGYTYDNLKNPDKALINYQKSLDISPDYYDACKAIGDIYYTKNEYKKAAEYFKKYADGEKEPDNFYYYKTGWSLSDIGEYEDAITYLEKYNPEETLDKVKKYSEIGYANYSLKKYDAAIEFYKKAIDLKDDYGIALRGLGNSYYDKNENDQAFDYYKQAIEKDEANSGSCYYKMGWIYNDHEKYDEAISVLLKAVAFDGKDAGNREELGFAYYKKDRYDDAIDQLNKAIELDPKSKLGYYYKGLCYISLKKKSDAMNMYDKLKAINEDQASKLLVKINAM